MFSRRATVVRIMFRAACSILLAVIPSVAVAQEGAGLPPRAVSIRAKVSKLAPHTPLTVITTDGAKMHGTLQAESEREFTIDDVISATAVTIRYETVRKIKVGYGQQNAHHGSHRRQIVVIIVASALLGGLIAAAATAKN